MIAASLHASWNTKNKIKGKIKKCNSNKMDARSDFKLLSPIKKKIAEKTFGFKMVATEVKNLY